MPFTRIQQDMRAAVELLLIEPRSSSRVLFVFHSMHRTYSTKIPHFAATSEILFLCVFSTFKLTN